MALTNEGSEMFAVDINSLQETRITYRTPESSSAFASWGPGHLQEERP